MYYLEGEWQDIRAFHNDGDQGWGPRGLASTSRTARGQNFVALASKTPGLGLDHVVLEHIPDSDKKEPATFYM